MAQRSKEVIVWNQFESAKDNTVFCRQRGLAFRCKVFYLCLTLRSMVKWGKCRILKTFEL